MAVLFSLVPAAPAARQPRRVLFIGNSLTAANDLPGLVAAISRAAGQPLECVSIAFPDHGLEEHWERGDARKAIARGGWSYVVLQQGPSALPESRVVLRQFARRFDAEIKRVGARTALYMVWPSSARSRDFDGVIRSYSMVSAELGALLLPVGEAWQAAWRQDSKAALYSPDGFHPSLLGSYLAALVIFERLSGVSSAGLPPVVSIPRPALQVLIDAAAAVNRP